MAQLKPVSRWSKKNCISTAPTIAQIGGSSGSVNRQDTEPQLFLMEIDGTLHSSSHSLVRLKVLEKVYLSSTYVYGL